VKKVLIVFLAGLFEQFGFTLYLLAVNKHLILVSSVLMFVYFITYLWIIDYAIKDNKTFPLLLTYALAAAVGNYTAMVLNLIK